MAMEEENVGRIYIGACPGSVRIRPTNQHLGYPYFLSTAETRRLIALLTKMADRSEQEAMAQFDRPPTQMISTPAAPAPRVRNRRKPE